MLGLLRWKVGPTYNFPQGATILWNRFLSNTGEEQQLGEMHEWLLQAAKVVGPLPPIFKDLKPPSNRAEEGLYALAKLRIKIAEDNPGLPALDYDQKVIDLLS